jgi:uncharacterized protein (TIGR00369 family)
MTDELSFGVVDPATILSVSGLAFLEGIRAGTYPRPPIMQVLDFDLASVAEGRVVFAGQPSGRFYNPLGGVHGGWTATLLDSCVACAIQSTLPAGAGYTTLELKVNYVRAIVAETGTLQAEGKVVHVGRRTATANGELRDASGQLYAHASTTCLVMAMS